jgi:hypothetical protein
MLLHPSRCHYHIIIYIASTTTAITNITSIVITFVAGHVSQQHQEDDDRATW